MKRDPEGRSLSIVHSGPGAHRHRPDLGWRIEKPLHVGRGEHIRPRGQRELSRDLPSIGLVNGESYRCALHSFGEHERRRHVEMRMGVIDAEVGAVDSVAPYGVADFHRSVVAAD